MARLNNVASFLLRAFEKDFGESVNVEDHTPLIEVTVQQLIHNLKTVINLGTSNVGRDCATFS